MGVSMMAITGAAGHWCGQENRAPREWLPSFFGSPDQGGRIRSAHGAAKFGVELVCPCPVILSL